MFFSRPKKKVFVALSGGVDSAVAAYLLKKNGHEVFAGFIRGYNVDGCQEKDAQDAAKVAAYLKIPFYSFDLEKEYEKRVVEYLLDGYKKGMTPNPDVVCNTEIKFGLFYNQVLKLGADIVASGHYAIIKKSLSGAYGLYAGADTQKDQSYFLWGVPQDRLAHIIFPVGKLTKKHVRIIAKKAGLPNADKKDSQGVCFLGKFDFNEFLREHLGTKEGVVLDIAGNVIGAHQGAHLYTIGQRHGFVNKTNEPLFVVAKDIKKNTLTAVHENNATAYTEEFIATAVHFLDKTFEKKMGDGKSVQAWGRCRYRQNLFECIVHMHGEYMHAQLLHKEKIFPAVGQSFVLYNSSKKVLAGSRIQGYEL